MNELWNGRWFLDAILLGYLAIFFLLKASLLRRETRLGWSMATVNVLLGVLFLYSLLFVPGTPPTNFTVMAIAIRLVLAVVLTWAAVELLLTRRAAREW